MILLPISAASATGTLTDELAKSCLMRFRKIENTLHLQQKLLTSRGYDILCHAGRSRLGHV